MRNLKEYFGDFGFEVSKTQEELFDKYFYEVIEVNKVQNLTAITSEDEFVIKHFLDSILPSREIIQNAKVCDVGSGAGFPALPLKILRDDLTVDMVDSLQKRVNFLIETVAKLGIDGAKAYHFRAEDWAKQNREKYDVCVARAVASSQTLLEYLLPLVKVGGIAILYKGSDGETEIENSRNALSILGGKIEKIEKYVLPEDKGERVIIVVRKIALTPLKYPRPKNLPKDKPL